MTPNKPGRVLFWVSIVCWTIGWSYALMLHANADPGSTAVAVFLFWGVAAFTGAIWVIIKVWQVMCRVRARELGRIDNGAELAIEGATTGRHTAARKVLTGIGVAGALAVIAMMAFTVYLYHHDAVPGHPLDPRDVPQQYRKARAAHPAPHHRKPHKSATSGDTAQQ